MKVLVVSQYFWPENFRINDLCSELVQRGHQVTVLTGTPNYPQGSTFSSYKNNPKIFSEYQGVDIVRVPMVVRGSGGSLKLILNYLSYAVSASVIGLFKLRKKKFDVIFIFQLSPVTLAIPGLLYKKLYKIPVVMWVLDLWPETLQAVGIVQSESALRWVGRLVAFIYNRCDYILGQSKGFFKGIGKYCIDTSKIKYFPSWSESSFSKETVTYVDDIVRHKDCFKVLFAGNVGDAQDFPSILDAVELLKQRKAKVKLFIVGDGRMFDWVKGQINKRALQDNLILLGRHPLESMPNFYASADALLVALKTSEVFAMTIPGKIQSYMVAGRPILAMLDGEGERVVLEARAGLTCETGNYKELAEIITAMSLMSKDELSKMSANGKDYASNEFDREKLITQLEGWFEELVHLKLKS